MANLALVIATGIFVLLSVIGFFWMNKLIAQNSYSYLASLDYSNMWNIATASGCVALFAYIVYMINFPEGELARDAAATSRKRRPNVILLETEMQRRQSKAALLVSLWLWFWTDVSIVTTPGHTRFLPSHKTP